MCLKHDNVTEMSLVWKAKDIKGKIRKDIKSFPILLSLFRRKYLIREYLFVYLSVRIVYDRDKYIWYNRPEVAAAQGTQSHPTSNNNRDKYTMKKVVRSRKCNYSVKYFEQDLHVFTYQKLCTCHMCENFRILNNKNKQTPWPVVCKRTIPTEKPPLVSEISANFSG
jgi:hypothetical protein